MSKTGERSVWPRTSSAKVTQQKSTRRQGTGEAGRGPPRHGQGRCWGRCCPGPAALGSDGDLDTGLLIVFYTQHLWSIQYSPWSNFFNIWNKIEEFVLSRSGQIGCFHHWDDLKLLEF